MAKSSKRINRIYTTVLEYSKRAGIIVLGLVALTILIQHLLTFMLLLALMFAIAYLSLGLTYD